MTSAHLANRLFRGAALAIALAALGFTVWLVAAERSWNEANAPQPTPAAAFINGSIGTELAPLVAFEVLPDLFPDEFHPLDRLKNQPNGTHGDWIDQYGFIRKSLAPAENNDGTPLPVGFVLSHHRPATGAPSPVPFVGLSCAACHSAEIRADASKPGVVVYGVGNPTMNLLAFSEALRGVFSKKRVDDQSASEYVLTLEAIQKEQAKRGRTLTILEQTMVALWIRAARAEQLRYAEVIDDPLPPEQLFDPQWMPAGPARTQPFRSLVRVHLNRPGMSARAAMPDQGFSKIPVVYFQAHEYHGDWAQFDGSVKNIVARSTFAASTAGANVNNLSVKDLAANIYAAAEYTEKLAPPKWADVFGQLPDREKAASGRAVYRDNCYGCHGGPDDRNGWTHADVTNQKYRFGEVVPLSDLGTDPERVTFRHAAEVTQVLFDEFNTDFRKDHPLGTFTKDELRANVGNRAGYYNGPIAGAFLRAPYLHNASVLTLAELIGLESRRAKFYRGRNPYDLARVGYQSPAVEAIAPTDSNYYFLFDTNIRGNSNRGHRYPSWAFPPDGHPVDPKRRLELENLLEYLKSL